MENEMSKARRRNAPPLTQQVCYDAGEAAANQQMRAACRSKWSAADHRLACITNARLAIKLGGMREVAARDVLKRMGVAA